jgi:hypothetical protein
MFGIIADMSPIIRNSYENIISFFMFESNKPNLNLFLKKYVAGIKIMTQDGLHLDGIGRIKIRIIGFIADSQALPKVLNTKQYNCRFGCIHCTD